MNDFSTILELDTDNLEAKTGLEMAKNILSTSLQVCPIPKIN